MVQHVSGLALAMMTDDQLVELGHQIAIEKDSRLPLDPEPWVWPGYWNNEDVRQAYGPGNDGPSFPRGELSRLRPRKGYRQDRSAYSHTVLEWVDGHGGLKAVYEMERNAR